jgi:hypothetical protein
MGTWATGAVLVRARATLQRRWSFCIWLLSIHGALLYPRLGFIQALDLVLLCPRELVSVPLVLTVCATCVACTTYTFFEPTLEKELINRLQVTGMDAASASTLYWR